MPAGGAGAGPGGEAGGAAGAPGPGSPALLSGRPGAGVWHGLRGMAGPVYRGGGCADGEGD